MVDWAAFSVAHPIFSTCPFVSLTRSSGSPSRVVRSPSWRSYAPPSFRRRAPPIPAIAHRLLRRAAEIAWAVLPGIALARGARVHLARDARVTRRSSTAMIAMRPPALARGARRRVLHLVFGAIVRISGSGMGCGDNWPKCYGYWFPPFSRPDLIVEVSHRYLASILDAHGRVAGARGVRAARRSRRRRPRRAAALAQSARSPPCSPRQSSAASR